MPSPAELQSRAIFDFAKEVTIQSMNARGVVQMQPGAAITLGAILYGLSLSPDTARTVEEAAKAPEASRKQGDEILRTYEDKVRRTTEADQQKEAGLVALAMSSARNTRP